MIAIPGIVPNAGPHLGSLVETFRPWLGLAVPVLLLAALLRRSTTALLAVVALAGVWSVVFAAAFKPGDGTGGIVAVQHNASDENPDPQGTARALLAAGPDLVALEEVLPEALPAYSGVLDPELPYRAVSGTVALWSRYPLTDVRPLDIKPEAIGDGWQRALRATAAVPGLGPVAVYVAHLPSLRLGLTGFGSGPRDEGAAKLGPLLTAEPVHRLILLGDLNATTADRGLRPVTRQLNAPPEDFTFSWPASSPVARIDQVLARGGKVPAIRALPATGSDHLPVVARVVF
ncbi:hypothetical protein Afil01_26170 [Actinorhabdospora filicis]|uniref:Endonuclease/exonuclease/phosphatase domain-containing protein n=1 Tax=Actinorhabdospora filicis TaxID=1785913 RepID=A0A9W6WAM8_9ACTN|nr:endonuclease/exonuclease/phosphatase family protein [Actinorhabdospora filicis]GLZ77810.1 hypothetical protein Afil01_26170 [Actinorhabdospora filicis]